MMGMRARVVTPIIASILILAFPLASGHGNIDQSFPGPCTGGGLNVFVFGLAGQSFTPTATNLVAVDLIINSAETPTTYTLNIRSGSITGTIIGTSSTVIASAGDGPLEHFDFPTIVPLIPGNLYVIEVTGSGVGFWCTSTANPYAGGTAILDGNILTNRDMGFTTYFSNPPPSADKLNPFLGDIKCYNVNVVQHFVDDVILTDQFETNVQYDIEDIIKICTMVFKAVGVDFPESASPQFFEPFPGFDGTDEQHFVVYELCRENSDGPTCIPPDPVNFPVSIMDQFGTTDHETLHQPVELWVPASKEHIQCPSGYTFDSGSGKCVGPLNPCPPPDAASFPPPYTQMGANCVGDPIADFFLQEQNIDFKCYDIEPKGIGTKLLQLFDDNFFPTGDDVQIDTADKLCNPVLKNGESQQSLDIEHLKCYEFTVLDTVDAQFTIFDQFHLGGLSLQTIDGEEFCSAADKFIIAGQPIGGTLIPIDRTSLLLVGAQMTASWMIPVIIAGIGIAIVIARKF